MHYNKFLREILSSMLCVTSRELYALYPIYQQYLAGKLLENEPEKPKPFAFSMNGFMDEEEEQESDDERILVIPIEGMMTRSGGSFSLGSMEIGEMITEAYSDDKIRAIVMRHHSGGGSVHSISPIANALKKDRNNKPVLSAVDTVSGSASYYPGTYADEIIATHEMAEVGSIGVMARVINDKEMLKEEGIKIEYIVPPESKWKNKPIREAEEGKPQLLIKEELSPWAQHFQNIVKTNRGDKLNLETEGILEGREFFAYDAVNNGLIDSIMDFEAIMDRAFELSKRNEITKMF